MGEIDAELATEPNPAGWMTLDNSDEPVQGTVDRVLAMRLGAR